MTKIGVKQGNFLAVKKFRVKNHLDKIWHTPCLITRTQEVHL